MPRHQCKSTINNSQSNMSPLEPSNLSTTGLEYSNITETQEKKKLKTNYMEMIKILKEKMH